MATYEEIRNLFSDSDLLTKVQVATIIAANDLIGGTPTTAEKAWASEVFGNLRGESEKARMAVLAENKDLTVAQIQSATDAAVQGQVNAVVPTLVDAFSGA